MTELEVTADFEDEEWFYQPRRQVPSKSWKRQENRLSPKAFKKKERKKKEMQPCQYLDFWNPDIQNYKIDLYI